MTFVLKKNICVISLSVDGWWAHYWKTMYMKVKGVNKWNTYLYTPSFTNISSIDENHIVLNWIFGLKKPLYHLVNLKNYLTFFLNLKKRNIDEVLFASNSLISFVFLLITYSCKIKNRTIFHDPIPHSWEYVWLLKKPFKYIRKWFVKITNQVIVHWEKLRNDVIAVFSADSKKVVAIHHWNYNDIVHNYQERDPEKNTILFFWRIVAYKWLEVLLQAMDILKKDNIDVKLLIAWSWDITPYLSSIELLWKDIEVDNRHIPDEELSSIFTRSLCCILPYHDATATWVVPISYWCERTVIVSDVWELPTVVIHWQTWYIFEKWNVAALAEMIKLVLSDKQKSLQMWKEWKHFANTVLSRETQIEKIYS